MIMILPFPSNLLPWLIGSVVIGLFGVRAFVSYRRLNAPLSRYFMISALLMSLALGLWSWPFLFTRSETAIRTLLIVGDVSFYSMLAYQTRIIWYLGLSHIPYIWLLVPTLIVAIPGLAGIAYAELTEPVGVVNGVALYPVNAISHVSQMILLVGILMVGSLVLWRVRAQKGYKARLNLASVAVLYIFGGLAGFANILLSEGTNQSAYVNIAYFVAFAGIVATFLLFRVGRTS